MEGFQEITGSLPLGKLKKFMPFIVGGVVLGGIGYFMTRGSSSTERSPDTMEDLTSKVGGAGGGGGSASGGSSSTPLNGTASFVADALQQVYAQTKVDQTALATEFRNNDATISKQLTDLQSEIQSSLKTTVIAQVETPTTTAPLTRVAQVTPSIITTPTATIVSADSGAIKNSSGEIVGGQGGGAVWGQDVWNALWNTPTVAPVVAKSSSSKSSSKSSSTPASTPAKTSTPAKVSTPVSTPAKTSTPTVVTQKLPDVKAQPVKTVTVDMSTSAKQARADKLKSRLGNNGIL